MDTNTATWVVGVVTLLIVLNYFLEGSSVLQTRQLRGRPRFNVTQDMITAVQAVAPGLSVAQIRADLQLTGNVQSTVDRYLTNTIPELPQPEQQSISIKKSLSDEDSTEDGDSEEMFGEMSFRKKKMEMIMSNRHKLEMKRGILSYK